MITTMSRQLPDGLLEELKDAINAPTNLNIIPTSVHEQAGGIFAPSHSKTNLFYLQKRAIEDASLAEDDAEEK